MLAIVLNGTNGHMIPKKFFMAGMFHSSVTNF